MDSTTLSRTTSHPLPRAVLLAAALGTVGVALTHLLFDLAGADFRVQPPGQPATTVGVGQAAGVTFGVTVVGGLVAALLTRRAARPDRWFTGTVVLALVVFAANPVLAADQLLTVVALEVEHLVAAAAALAVLLPVLRTRARA